MGYAKGESVIGTSNLEDNAITLAKLAAGTDGELITWDASGDPAAVAVGTAGQVLTSGGAGVAPTMQTLSAGKLVGIKSTTGSTVTSTTGTTQIDATGVTLTYTQAASANYTLLMFSGVCALLSGTSGTNLRGKYFLLRDSTQIATQQIQCIAGLVGGNLYSWNNACITAYSTAGDTSSHTYKLQLACTSAAASTTTSVSNGISGSSDWTLTIMEFEV
jgi:hypothetical protein